MDFQKIGKIYILLLALLHFSHFLNAQITIGSTEVDTQSVATNLDTPWEILWGPDDHIWLTERYGRVSRLNPRSGEIQELITIDEVYETNESGLLGMALHPNFQDTSYVYLIYNYLEGSSIKERLVRYTYENEELSSPSVLMEGIDGSSIHNGSRIVIDSLRRLYFTTGDASNTSHSQNLDSRNGKILRMNLDGTIPDDNPFQNSYVWTYGHRNPQGLVISPEGIMYSSEHGPASDDELNIIEKGRNYGWPDVMGYCDEASETSFCEDNNVKEPIAVWTPTLAVAGITHYHHNSVPEWDNSILMTTLKESEVVQLKLSEDGTEVAEETVWFDDWFGRLRDVCVSPEGKVYLAVSNRDGREDPGLEDDRIVEFAAATSTSLSSFSKEAQTLEIYPNPMEGITRLIIPEDFVDGTIKLYNTLGSLVFREKAGREDETLDVRQFNEGIYIIVLQKGSRQISERVILK